MNTVEKLYKIHESKTEKAYHYLPLEVRIQMNRMFNEMKWVWENSFNQEEARSSRDAQNAFMEQYEIEGATVVKKAYENIFGDV